MFSLIHKVYSKYGNFIKFCVVGGMNTGVSLVFYWLLLKLGMHYLYANGVGYIAGVLTGYILSSKYVFKTKKTVGTFLKFIFVYLITFVVNIALMYILVDKLLFSEIIAPVIVIMINLIINYFLNKMWTFRLKKAVQKDG